MSPIARMRTQTRTRGGEHRSREGGGRHEPQQCRKECRGRVWPIRGALRQGPARPRRRTPTEEGRVRRRMPRTPTATVAERERAPRAILRWRRPRVLRVTLPRSGRRGHGRRRPSLARSRRVDRFLCPAPACCERRSRHPHRCGSRRCERRRRRSSTRVRSTSGSIAAPSPISSIPVTGGRVCRSTPLPDSRAECACVVDDPRGSGESDGVDLVGDLLGEPQAQVDRTTTRIVARPDPGQQQSRRHRGDRHAAPWRGENQKTDEEQRPRHDREDLEPRHRVQQSGCRQQIQQPPDARRARRAALRGGSGSTACAVVSAAGRWKVAASSLKTMVPSALAIVPRRGTS